MTLTTVVPVRRFARILLLIATSSTLWWTAPIVSGAADPASGTIAGAVSNKATGANLEGAQLTLQPGNVSVLTTRDGHFVLPHLAPGSYEITVNYAGLDPRDQYLQCRIAKSVSVHLRSTEPHRSIHHPDQVRNQRKLLTHAPPDFPASRV